MEDLMQMMLAVGVGSALLAALVQWQRRCRREEAAWEARELALELEEERRQDRREWLEERRARKRGRSPSSMPFPIRAMPNSPRSRRFARVQGGPARYWVGDELLVGGEPHRVEAVLYSGDEVTYCTRAVEERPAWTQQLGNETRPLDDAPR